MTRTTSTTDKRTTLYTKTFPDYYYCYSFVDIPLIPIVYIVIHLSRSRCGPHNFSFSFFFLVENINNTQTDTLYYSRVCADIENPSRFFRYFLCWFASASVRFVHICTDIHYTHTHAEGERQREREITYVSGELVVCFHWVSTNVQNVIFHPKQNDWRNDEMEIKREQSDFCIIDSNWWWLCAVCIEHFIYKPMTIWSMKSMNRFGRIESKQTGKKIARVWEWDITTMMTTASRNMIFDCHWLSC